VAPSRRRKDDPRPADASRPEGGISSRGPSFRHRIIYGNPKGRGGIQCMGWEAPNALRRRSQSRPTSTRSRCDASSFGSEIG